jgi:hypothetical protein
MKRTVFLLSFILCTLILRAQEKVTLMHQDTSREYTVTIVPFIYTNEACKKFSLKVRFTYNEYDETISALLTCPDSTKYDMIWKPRVRINTKGGKTKGLNEYFNKYGEKVSLSKHFKKQVKDQRIDFVDSVSCENCRIQGYRAGRKKFENPNLENELFYLKNLELKVIFDVANKSNPEINFCDFIPVLLKGSSDKKKLELQYVAQGPIFKFSIKQDPCIEESNEIGREFMGQTHKMEHDYAVIAAARNQKNRALFDQLKLQYENEYKTMIPLKVKYAQSRCDSIQKLITLLRRVTEIPFEPCQSFEVKDLTDSIMKSYSVVNDYCKKKMSAEQKADWKEVNRLAMLLTDFKNENEVFKDRLAYSPYQDCSDLGKLMIKHSILLNSCIGGAGTSKCKVYISEFKRAGSDINELINRWNSGELKKHDRFEEIISKTDPDVDKARTSCQNNSNVTGAIHEYESFRASYIEITKYNKKHPDK